MTEEEDMKSKPDADEEKPAPQDDVLKDSRKWYDPRRLLQPKPTDEKPEESEDIHWIGLTFSQGLGVLVRYQFLTAPREGCCRLLAC